MIRLFQQILKKPNNRRAVLWFDIEILGLILVDIEVLMFY